MRTLLILLFVLGNSALFAQEFSWEDQPPILENDDSLIVKADPNFGTYINYRMKDFQTLYRVSKFFGSSIDEVYRINKINSAQALPEQLMVKIPLDTQHIITNFWGRSLFKRYTSVYYKVQPKQTLFHIGHNLFGMELKVLKRRNNLRDESLQSGQLLEIGWFPQEGLFEPITSKEMEADGYSWDELELTYAKAADRGKVKQQKGIAFWNKKQTAAEGLFVLHKEAKVNSYIEIINPMFGTKIYAKVVGRIPENAYPSEVLAVISSGAAKELRARDARFFVKMRYLQPGTDPLVEQ